jgi:hypothetical protein
VHKCVSIGEGGGGCVLLVQRHFELNLSQRTKVLSRTDAAIAVCVVVQKTVQRRGQLVRVQVAIACRLHPSVSIALIYAPSAHPSLSTPSNICSYEHGSGMTRVVDACSHALGKHEAMRAAVHTHTLVR